MCELAYVLVGLLTRATGWIAWVLRGEAGEVEALFQWCC